MASASKKKKPVVESNYVPVEQDRVALAQYVEKRKDELSVRIKVKSDGAVPKLTTDHPNEVVGYIQLMQALATVDPDFVNGILKQLANAGSQGREVDEAGANFMLSVIKGIKPKDQVETMLAAQMAAVHMATMTFARRLAHVENIPQQDGAERAFNKLIRTFATQMEALKRYRTGGEQKVTVQHVSVNEGGQAIVGNVSQSARENAPGDTVASPLAITDAKATPMPMVGETKVAAAVPARRRRDK